MKGSRKMREYEMDTLEVSAKEIKKLQRTLWTTRLFSALLTLLMLGMLAGGYYIFRIVRIYAVQAESYVTDIMVYAESLEPIMTQLSEVDMELLNHTFEQITLAFEVVDFEQLAKQMSELDVEEINAKLETLDVEGINAKLEALDVEGINAKLEALDVEALNAKLSALDIEAINDTIESINAVELGEALTDLNLAVDTVQEMSDKLQQVAMIFSGDGG